MKNPKYWRKRTSKEVREKIEKLEREAVFEKIGDNFDERQLMRDLNQLRKLAKLPSLPFLTHKKLIRRLRRKLRRIENGTYKG